jgi:hypothetical protein
MRETCLSPAWKRACGVAVALALCACHRAGPSPVSVELAAPPPPPSAPAKPVLLASADVDALLRAEWRRAGVTPVAAADDATWLRRAWIDVLGTIPPAEETARFLADRSAGKRDRMIDAMLAAPAWADHWTAYWDDVLMGRDARGQDVDRGAFRAWLRQSFARNAPWDRIVTELLTASGLNSDGGRRRDAEANDGTVASSPSVNGAVNWTLKYVMTPQDMAGAASRTLLAVQIQCAQCHDHKTEKWTQRDFQGFAAAFVRTRLVPIDEGRAMGDVHRVEVRDIDHAAPRFGKMGDLDAIAKATPTALDGEDLAARGPTVRAALAGWMTAPQNPWFSRAFVNRMWGHFFGRGFVDPVDDLRPSNPATAPAVLDALSADFVRSGYDIKHLVRVVAGCDAYGLASIAVSEATQKADPEAKLWEHFRVTPLGPEELLNALVAATRLDTIVRSTGRLDLDRVRFRVRERYGFLFDIDEENDDDEYQGTVAQSLALLNGAVVAAGASVLPGGALAEVLGMPGDAAADPVRLESLYLRVLSRLPDREEIAFWTKFVADADAAPEPAPGPARAAGARAKKSMAAGGRQPDPLRNLGDRAGAYRANARARAWEDILWTLLNASEFVLNH